MLDDPRVNFAISKRGANSGLQHLGIQVETENELSEVYERLQHAGRPVIEEGETTCCYANSRKSWITDPQGLWWETFLTSGESTVYGGDPALDAAPAQASPCCTPKTPQGECCPAKPELAAAARLLRLEGFARHDRSRLQRAVSVHRQHRALDPRGEHFA